MAIPPIIMCIFTGVKFALFHSGPQPQILNPPMFLFVACNVRYYVSSIFKPTKHFRNTPVASSASGKPAWRRGYFCNTSVHCKHDFIPAKISHYTVSCAFTQGKLHPDAENKYVAPKCVCV